MTSAKRKQLLVIMFLLFLLCAGVLSMFIVEANATAQERGFKTAVDSMAANHFFWITVAATVSTLSTFLLVLTTRTQIVKG